MSAPIRPPLTVREADGNPSGRPINTIVVTNGSLSVSGTTATISTGGGGGGTGTVRSVGLTETGTALTITGSPVTTSGTINIAGAGTSSQVILGDLSLGTLPSGTVTSITATSPLTGGVITTSGSIGIPRSSLIVDGYLNSADFTTFNNKQDTLILTTTGSSGAATLTGSTLNIPQYSGGGGGTIGGSITNTQVARGATTADEIEGDSGLLFDGTSLTVNTLSAVDPIINMSSNTKSVSLEVETSQTLSIKGSANSFIFDASSATSGMTFPDGTTQSTASGGGGTFTGSLADTQIAFGNTAANSIQGSSNLTFDGNNLSLTGYVKAGAGLVTAPAYSFTAADDVGMYLTGTNILHFTAGNSDLMNLQHDGTATNVRLGNGTGGAALSSKGLTNLTLQTNDGVNSGTIVIEDSANGQISITPNGTGTIKLDGVELDNTAIATGYILKASSATAAGWVAESAGGGNDFNAELVGVELDASGTGYAVFDILSSAPYGVARYTTGGVDTKQYFYPFIAPKSGSLSEIIVNLTAAAGSATNLYYGFYRDNNGVPDSMLGYATVDATSTGSISVTSFSATVTFTRGDQFWLSQSKSTSQSITQRSIANDYMPRIAPTEAFPSTTNGYYTSLATNSAVTAVPADITAEGLEGGVYFSGLGSKPHIGIKIL